MMLSDSIADKETHLHLSYRSAVLTLPGIRQHSIVYKEAETENW